MHGFFLREIFNVQTRQFITTEGLRKSLTFSALRIVFSQNVRNIRTENNINAREYKIQNDGARIRGRNILQLCEFERFDEIVQVKKHIYEVEY